ncbi:chaperonin 10-like protein [Limtongia smithiae]|uniref:chaperonin 10-like protein n=1 Tax=Limtongia smithiae TaxID=1125753 RepID=UPI0034CDA8AB
MAADTHIAAVLTEVGRPLELVHRPTPRPGANEVLIAVKAVAFNPLDYVQRDRGFNVARFPAVVGSDIAGIIIARGSALPDDAAPPVGARVCAKAPTFATKAAPDYGGLQEIALVPAANVMLLPDDMPFESGASLPMAVVTTWSGWYTIGMPRETKFMPEDKMGMLVWGGASSIGSAAVQISAALGFVVYAVASEKHSEYVKQLGAHKVFDYKCDGAADAIVKAAKDDGVWLNTGFDAVGATADCLQVLREFVDANGVPTRLAEAVPMFGNAPQADGVIVKFIVSPLDDAERAEFTRFVFAWLATAIDEGRFVPSPPVRIMEGGLASADKAMDILRAGVSGTKLVIEV